MLDRYLYNKEDMSKKFPAVMTTEEFLGMEKGTVLRFDMYSAKYISREEDEEVLTDDYYYSGYCVAIDPYTVKDNIGKLFAYIEEDEVQSEEGVSEDQKTPKEPEEDKNTEVGVQEGTTFPEYTRSHSLVVDCACGHRKVVDSNVIAPGISATIMADDENSFIELSCPECKSSMKLWLDYNGENIDEHTEEESK